MLICSWSYTLVAMNAHNTSLNTLTSLCLTLTDTLLPYMAPGITPRAAENSA